MLHEITLIESIRYADGDPVEAWLNSLLCLDAGTVPRILSGCPVPDKCELYYVNRDTLFSYHKASEAFLHRVMALCVASHYKVRWTWGDGPRSLVYGRHDSTPDSGKIKHH